MRDGVMNMFTFALVKRIGEGSYLNEDLFILERVRRQRALNKPIGHIENSRRKLSTLIRKDGTVG